MSKVVRAEKVEKESLERELTPIPFGTRVRLRGLRTKPELNGQPGIIIGYDVDLMRCKVGMLVPDGVAPVALVTFLVAVGVHEWDLRACVSRILGDQCDAVAWAEEVARAREVATDLAALGVHARTRYKGRAHDRARRRSRPAR